MTKNDSDVPIQIFFIVLAISFCSILFELIISRIAVFYLNNADSFLAIPLALFGLAMGSLRIHLSQNSPDRFKLSLNLFLLTLVSFAAFAGAFILFSSYFPIMHHHQVNATTAIKLLVFAALFLPPFYFVGKILTALFSRHAKRIGKLYAFDLAGASSACFVTPLLFHFLDLPYLVFTGLAALCIVSIFTFTKRRIAAAFLFACLLAVVLPGLIYFEGQYYADNSRGTELDHRWNEYSRVTLFLQPRRGKHPPRFKIIHNNGESHVNVAPYKPRESNPGKLEKRMALPFRFDREVKDILVMFAGCGKQMLAYEQYSPNTFNITGVEINPLVVKFAEESQALKSYFLSDFFKRPNIHMKVTEGRYFLENDQHTYDLILAASAAPTSHLKTGHSRKYLDTTEAMEAYIDHLRPEGMLIFHAQPSDHKLRSLKKVWAKKGLPDFENCVLVLSRKYGLKNVTAVSLRPYTKKEKKIIHKQFKHLRQYVPGYKKNNTYAQSLITKPLSEMETPPNDDRPYIYKVDFNNYHLIPPKEKLKSLRYYWSWVKITTLLVVGIAVATVLAFLYLSKANLPPSKMMLILLISGFAYMMCEICFIARLELIMGNPLYSMALLLSIFLLTNAVGSYGYRRFQNFIDMRWFPLFVAFLLVATTLLMKLLPQTLGWPLALKIPLAVVLLSPVGICLGVFYPFVVTWLGENGKEISIPVTYAVSTLSSVAGATYAMVAIINLGYSNILYQAAGSYTLLALVVILFDRFRR